MRHSVYLKRCIAGFVAVIFSMISVIVAPAQAVIVSTETLLQDPHNNLARQKVTAFLKRQDVVHHLQSWGVSPGEAQARVNAMSNEEITVLAAKIDMVPAGGDALGFVLLISIVAFMTLVITDILGVTDVFTFIKKR